MNSSKTLENSDMSMENLYTFVDLSCSAMNDEIQCPLKMLKRVRIDDSNY